MNKFKRKNLIPLCACGCGQNVKWHKRNKKWNIFLNYHNRKGTILSEKHKKEISIALTGIKRSDKTKKKISNANKGRIFSKEAKRNMGRGQIGRTFSEEHKRKISDGNKDKKASLQTKLKISIGHMKRRTDGYCDIWSDLEYKKDCLKEYCEICGIEKTKKIGADRKLFSNLGLHHKDSNKKNCSPNNLSTLCKSCHAKLHAELRKRKAVET